MSNVLHIDHVEVRYRCDGESYFGLILLDDFESCVVLDFEREAEVPDTVRQIVEFCREEYHVNGIDLFERCAEEGHPALLDGEPVDPAELKTAVAETRDD